MPRELTPILEGLATAAARVPVVITTADGEPCSGLIRNVSGLIAGALAALAIV